ncbi:MAG: Asp-tRNA(Asn)/Glu-tRNA(Gln) amidotransferase subunit GatB [Clostridiaceae bacterium]|nr:Asp-tRNA(Asn)/Glu-tRNA(Gln) amidotransferase subunit GatB [Clostridiaceae bacterium]
MPYEIVIGLEIHAELNTKSKIFCGCKNEFGGEPNSNCCPVCLGMPGTLPVLNKEAVIYAIKAGLAMNCRISEVSKMDRKNYFYPDMPKAYQVSQYDIPLCYDGYVEIEADGQTKNIGIERIHLEEDAGKLMHDPNGQGTLIDYNRAGVPLIEIVTRPDIRSPKEARVLFENIKSILEYTGVCDCQMQEGSLRADVNLSVRPTGQETLGTRTEMKNLNSFRAVERACEAEAKRQIELLEKGLKVVQETRRWDDSKQESYPMREKEESLDYRFFPEPDLVPIVVDKTLIKNIKASIPELPGARKKRYINELEIPAYDANIITSDMKIADFFEEATKVCSNYKLVSNWLLTDLLRLVKEKGQDVMQKLTAQKFGELMVYYDKGEISQASAKKVLDIVSETGEEPGSLIERLELKVQRDENLVESIVKKVVQDNPKAVSDYKSGKTKAFGFLMGRVMAQLKGNGDPEQIKRLLTRELKSLME